MLGSRLRDLSIALYVRFEQLGGIEYLEEAITHFRQLERFNHYAIGDYNRSTTLNSLAIAVQTRFKQLGRMKDLEEAITCYRQALALLPHGHPNHPLFLINLGYTMSTRFEQLGRMEDLAEAITCHRQALALLPHGHPNRSDSLNNFSIAVFIRFKQLGRMEDLEEAIACYRQALTLQPHAYPNRSLSLSNLGSAMSSRFEQLGKMEDLEEAITCHRQAVALRPHGHPNHSDSLNNLANAVFARFEQFGAMEDLEETIRCFRQTVTLLSHGHPNRSSLLSNLSVAMITLFHHLGRMEDLEEAITCNRQALALRPHGHPYRSDSLNNLGNATSTRFQQLGRMEDLEEAITCHRQALALRPHDHPYRSDSLSNLGNAVSTRFQQLGRMEDLEEAITCHRQAVALRPHGHPNCSDSLNNLAIAVFTRFEQFGAMEDLEETIRCFRQTFTLLSHGHRNCSSLLSNLSVTVTTRFHHLGRMEDLEEAIACLRQALILRPHGHPNRSDSLNNLGNAVSTRFQQLKRKEDLEEAITCHRRALALRPHDHPNRSDSLNNLGNAVSTRFHQLERMEDLEEAITCYHQTLALRSHGHPNRSDSLINLGIAISTQFSQSRSYGDLLDAVKYLSEARNTLPARHPYQSMAGSNLASTLLIQCDIVAELDESLSVMKEAFELFEHAANHSPASAKDRFGAAVTWAREAHHRDHRSAVHAYTKSLTLLGRRLILAPTIESQQSLLASVPTALALHAASCSINRGEFRSAIELLEQGRAVLWSKLRGYRHPLDKLRNINKELFDQFETLGGQLECLAMSVESGLKLTASSESNVEQPFGSSFEAKMQRHRIISESWDDVVDKIRQIEGFSDFLRAVPFATLQTAAAEGPIIVINISQYRSDAVILQYIGDPVIVPLPGTLPEILEELSSQFATACVSHGKNSARLILPILRSLWDNIAFPVRTQLVAFGVADKSRIWWCPTSKLCGLPLHAAGIYSSKVPKPNCIPDCYVSSYTPSLSALIKARSGLVNRTTNPNLLVIAQPDETLPKVEEEIDHIQRLSKHNADVRLLEGQDANHDTVLSGLRTHSWVHFACHGHLNDQPFHSSFQLHDNSRLELVKLIPAQFPDAELAFLSACHTAAGDVVGTPDEVVHLAAALQFCGFRSVVGTMWAMEDDDGMLRGIFIGICFVLQEQYRILEIRPRHFIWQLEK